MIKKNAAVRFNKLTRIPNNFFWWGDNFNRDHNLKSQRGFIQYAKAIDCYNSVNNAPVELLPFTNPMDFLYLDVKLNLNKKLKYLIFALKHFVRPFVLSKSAILFLNGCISLPMVPFQTFPTDLVLVFPVNLFDFTYQLETFWLISMVNLRQNLLLSSSSLSDRINFRKP